MKHTTLMGRSCQVLFSMDYVLLFFCNVSLPIPIWITSYITQKDVCHPSLSRETQSQGVAVLMYKANTRFRMKCIFVLNKGFVSVGILQKVDFLGFSRGCFLWAKLLIWCLPISDHILYRCRCSTLRVSKCLCVVCPYISRTCNPTLS